MIVVTGHEGCLRVTRIYVWVVHILDCSGDLLGVCGPVNEEEFVTACFIVYVADDLFVGPLFEIGEALPCDR